MIQIQYTEWVERYNSATTIEERQKIFSYVRSCVRRGYFSHEFKHKHFEEELRHKEVFKEFPANHPSVGVVFNPQEGHSYSEWVQKYNTTDQHLRCGQIYDYVKHRHFPEFQEQDFPFSRRSKDKGFGPNSWMDPLYKGELPQGNLSHTVMEIPVPYDLLCNMTASEDHRPSIEWYHLRGQLLCRIFEISHKYLTPHQQTVLALRLNGCTYRHIGLHLNINYTAVSHALEGIPVDGKRHGGIIPKLQKLTADDERCQELLRLMKIALESDDNTQ